MQMSTMGKSQAYTCFEVIAEGKSVIGDNKEQVWYQLGDKHEDVLF